MANRKGIMGLRSIPEHEDEQFLSKRWEDFDHSQKFGLGVWGSAWTIRDRKTSIRYVLQSCHQSSWTLPRFKLLEFARQREDLFVSPRFLFFRGETVYVCSDIGGICLAELIDSTVAIQEDQAAAILRQVRASSSLSQGAKTAEDNRLPTTTIHEEYLLRCDRLKCVHRRRWM
jgi:hypothetical protein